MTASSSGNLSSRNDRISAEAIDWVERADREDWSDKDRQTLDLWLSAATAHRIAYLRARDGWRRADRLVALRGTYGLPRRNAESPKGFFPRKTALGAVAAAAFAALWLGVPRERAVATSYSTPIGGHKVVSFADGTTLELNTDTYIRTQFDEHHRTVRLERGEVYFQVTHDPRRPFTVWARGSRIRDIGTKFVVRTQSDEARVALLEGSAEVDVPANPQIHRVVLAPGEVAMATANALSIERKAHKSIEDEVAWRRGVLVLDHTTLADAAAEMNRYNQRKIIVADSYAARQSIEGTFPATNVDLFGRVARSVLGLHVESKGQDLVISR